MYNIILDCDPGHDDAIAILLAGSTNKLNLLGITTTAGNQTIEKTTTNALNVVQYLDIKTKVYKGANRTITKECEPCVRIHGETGLDGFDFPKLQIHEEKMNAIDFIIQTIHESKEKVTMVTTGPMTNLALALVLDPSIKENIERIVLMGGSIKEGNVTPAAEFNIEEDSIAAKICFTSNLPIYMIGLDITRQVLVTKDIIERMSKIGTKGSELFTKLMIKFSENQRVHFGLDGGPLHDPCTIAYLIDNSLIEFKHVYTEIDTSLGISNGRTNCDLPGYLNKEANSYVGVNIDVEKFWDIIEESLRFYK